LRLIDSTWWSALADDLEKAQSDFFKIFQNVIIIISLRSLFSGQLKQTTTWLLHFSKIQDIINNYFLFFHKKNRNFLS